MVIALGILFPLVMVFHSLFLHLIPLVLLCISGLFANLIQALCFVCMWPISKNTYRKINRVVKELDWWVLVCLIDWWADVKVYIKRHASKELPETDDAVEKWCTDIFAAKDALLDKHIAEQTFGDQGLQAIGQPLKPFLVVIYSACLLVSGALKFNLVHCSTLLVFSTALFSGRMLALFGCGVLSQLQCSMQAYLTNINCIGSAIVFILLMWTCIPGIKTMLDRMMWHATKELPETDG